MSNDLIMPAEFYGAMKKSGGYTTSDPRAWTDLEIQWVTEKLNDGLPIDAIAEAIGRTSVSIQIKLKRLKKNDDTYNEKHRALKYAANEMFLMTVEPKTILDVYAGNSFYLGRGDVVVTNDKDSRFETDYSLDALSLLCQLYANDKKFDVIDLDPYGSAYDCFDLAIKMARKGIVISFGEWGHKRWKRFDFVKHRYGIESEDDFVEDAFIKEFQRIAAVNKKSATVIDAVKYSNFLRVYFSLERMVVTEQWENK